ncbi:universal stress protein [Flavobacterium sp. ZS1P14]|uniref:universal stress protein n=1 Tax=Flavobacterium sp. ZS1P14 TaxID=3401729 RepID=UPI003AAB5BE7
MKILLATDGSSYSKAAVNEVANRLFPVNTKVCIVSVYKRMSLINTLEPMGVSHEYYAEIDHNAFKAAEKITENAVEILRAKNPTLIVTTIVIDGSPKSAILKEAETFGADLIIVGAHGHGALEGFLLGSVSQAVALHAKCSVEIVRK